MNAKTILASLHAVLLALLLSSCHEPVPAGGSGTEILFTGRTYPEATTKTSYSGVINNANLERIDWEPGDDLTLVSPSARVYTNTSVQPWVLGHNQGSGTWSKVSYQLQNGTIQTDDARSLMRMVPKEATGLQWEDPGTYYIYGVYPSESSSDPSRPTISWSGTGAGQGNITATIPSSQGYASSAKEDLASPTPTGIKHITRIEPDMSKAYMYAGLEKEIAAGGSFAAELDFYPMFTAFEFGVKALPDPVTGNAVKIDIDWFELVSGSCALSGAFTSVVTVGNSCNQPSGSKATYTLPAYGAATGTVRLDMPRQAGTSNTAVSVSSEDSLVFTVFVLPKGKAYNSGTPSLGELPGESTITDLKVRFRIRKQGANQPWIGRELELKPKVKTNLNPGITLSANDFVEFPAGKKVRINGLQLPSQQDPWSFSVSATDLTEEISDVAVSPVQVQSWESVDPVDPLDKKIFSVTYNGVTTTSEGTEVHGQDIEVTSYPNPGMPPIPGYVGGDVPPSSGFEVSSTNLGGFNVEITGGASWYLNYGTTNRVMVTLAYNNDIDDGTDPGMGTPAAFSISDSKYGYFSPGNLQYRASTGTWRFAEHQWDYVGGRGGYNGSQQVGTVYEGGVLSDNTLVSPTYDGWIDLFGWGTSGYDGWAAGDYGSARFPWSTDIDYSNYGPTDKSQHLTGAFANGDWGYNTIMSGSVSVPGGTYRTLTDKEWEHLIDGRVTNDAGKCSFLKARINPAVGHYRMIKVTFRGVDDPSYAVTYMIKQPAGPINGLLLFPDGIDKTDAQVSGYTTMNTINAAYADVTWEAWKALQARGCVFLPAAGNRGDPTGTGTIMYSNNVMGFGYYHSASRIDSPSNGNRAQYSVQCYFYKDDTGATVNSNKTFNKSSTASVRLVREEAKPSAGTSSYVLGGNPF